MKHLLNIVFVKPAGQLKKHIDAAIKAWNIRVNRKPDSNIKYPTFDIVTEGYKPFKEKE